MYFPVEVENVHLYAGENKQASSTRGKSNLYELLYNLICEFYNLGGFWLLFLESQSYQRNNGDFRGYA